MSLNGFGVIQFVSLLPPRRKYYCTYKISFGMHPLPLIGYFRNTNPVRTVPNSIFACISQVYKFSKPITETFKINFNSLCWCLVVEIKFLFSFNTHFQTPQNTNLQNQYLSSTDPKTHKTQTSISKSYRGNRFRTPSTVATWNSWR